MKFPKRTSLALIILLLVFSTQSFSSEINRRESVAQAIPNPILFFTGQEFYEASGKQYIRYRYDVLNKNEYPNELFAAAPDLPPCGQNTKASRTWVDFYDLRGKRLYGFCGFGKSADLGTIWFALEADVLPPSYVYIEINDRKTPTKYKSNLADTTL